MNIDFMRDYYRSKYEDPVGEICKGDIDFKEICSQVYEDIEKMEDQFKELPYIGKYKSTDEMESWLQDTCEELKKCFNKTLDDLGEKYTYIIEKAYLQGASDRDWMLK